MTRTANFFQYPNPAFDEISRLKLVPALYRRLDLESDVINLFQMRNPSRIHIKLEKQAGV